VWAIAVLAAMLFPMDLDRAGPTVAGAIHEISGFIGFFCLSAGVFLVSRRLTTTVAWYPLRPALRVLGALMPLEYAAMAIAYASGSPFAGLGQRIFLATMLAWFYLTAMRLRSTGAHPD
jgi:hypothetical protein